MQATVLAMPKAEEKKDEKRKHGSGRIWRRGKTLLIGYYDTNGKRRWENATKQIEAERRAGKRVSDDEKFAEQLLRKRIGARENGILPPLSKSRVTVAELYEDEKAYLENSGKSKTAAWLKSRWNLRLSDAFGPRRAREIRLADLVAYQTQRMDAYRKKFPNATAKKLAACESAVNSDLAALRMMFYKGKKLDKVDVVPTFPEKLGGALEREGTISPEQFQAMMVACQPDELWLKAFLTMAHTWGYRLRELLNLQVARVNLKDRTVYLPPRSTKNKKPRLIPISEAEIPLLLFCIEGKSMNDFVLTRKDGKQVLDFRARWEQLVTEAKAGHLEIDLKGNQIWCPAIPHDLRRTAISRMLSGGMPPEAVRLVVGHISPEMTQRYYRPAIDTLRRLQKAAEANLAVLATDDQIPTNRRLSNGYTSDTIQENSTTKEKQVL